MRQTIFTDSHAHLTNETVFDGLAERLQRAQKAGVQRIVNICTDLRSLERGLELSRDYPWISQAAATTPHDVEREGEEVFSVIATHARQGHLQAIGETGLDYHYEHSCREIQKKFLRRYLQLALECHLPVIIHCREAFSDLFTIVDEEYRIQGRWGPGVLHCFTGNQKEAEEVLKRGWMLSLSGIVTFKKSLELQEIARLLPLNQCLIETDTPYLAPQKYRGQPNEPAFLIETAAFLASLKNLSIEEIAQITTKNGAFLFGMI